MFLCAFWSLGILSASAQENEQKEPVKFYETLKSTGQLPDDFVKSKEEKVREGLAEIRKESDKSTLSDKERFILKSRYAVSDMLMSGNILFNDPISQYVSKVAKEVFKGDKKLSELRFYTYKSSSVNAFTTADGVVFVTTGLLAQLENEAQLAYILCHEAIHFRDAHSIDSYVESKKVEKSKEFKNLSYSDKKFALINYSKETEFEADEEGLKVFMKSNYNPQEIYGVFDVLTYSYLPFDLIDFEHEFLETEFIKHDTTFNIPSDEVLGIKGEEDYDDSKSSHPNTFKRVRNLEKYIENETTEGKKDFIVSKDEFLEIREKARYELTRLHLRNLNYPEAIYNSFLLSKSHPNDPYIEWSVIKALYGASKYKNDKLWNRLADDYEDIEGPSQVVHYFLYEIDPEVLSILAVAKAYEFHKKYPDFDSGDRLYQDAIRELIYEHEKYLSDFKKLDTAKIASTPTTEKSESKRLSKYDKIKKAKNIDVDANSTSYASIYAFTPYLDDNEFIETFDDEQDYLAKFIKIKNNEETAEEKNKRLEEKKQEKKHIKKYGKSLDIDKIVVLDPFYRENDETDKESVQYESSESKRVEYVNQIETGAKAAGLEVEVLDPSRFNTTDVDKLNDLSLLRDWIIERVAHGEQNVYNSTTDEVDALIEKYGTRYFVLTGVEQTKYKNPMKYYYACLYMALVYTAPIGIYYMLKQDFKSEYFYLLFDIKTGELMLYDEFERNSKAKKSIVASSVYHSLYQTVKEEPKKK